MVFNPDEASYQIRSSSGTGVEHVEFDTRAPVTVVNE
jgi:hypothetical protein